MVRWEHDILPRYGLLEDELDPQEYFALCVDIEGLYAAPPPPARERGTLVACAPKGPLADALAERNPTLIGGLALEGLRERQMHSFWRELENVIVLDGQPHPADPSLTDISIEVTVPDQDLRTPAISSFNVMARYGDCPMGTCQSTDGLFVPRPPPPTPPLRLIGCEPRGPLLTALTRPKRLRGLRAYVMTIDRNGRDARTSRMVDLDVVEAHPSPAGTGLMDVIVHSPHFQPLALAARPIWEMWINGGPQLRNLWAAYDSAGRDHWVEAALFQASPKPDGEPGQTYHLDGRYVTDQAGFYCAIGEAINGPGGYFGRVLDALADCCRGHFGAQPPFTLIWHHSEVARTHLPLEDERNITRHDTLKSIMDILGERGVDVVLT